MENAQDIQIMQYKITKLEEKIDFILDGMYAIMGCMQPHDLFRREWIEKYSNMKRNGK